MMNACHKITKRSRRRIFEHKGLATLKTEMMKLCPVLRCVWSDVGSTQTYFIKSFKG